MLLTTTASTHRSTHTIRTHKHTHRHARVHTPIHTERESLGELSADTHRRAEHARLHGTDHRVEASATAETRSPRSPHRSMPRYLEATLWSASQMTYTHDMKIVHTSHPSILPPRLQSGTSGGGFRGGRRNTHLPRRLHLASWSRSSHALTCPPNVRRCTRTHTHTRTHHDSRCCCPCYLRRRIRGGTHSGRLVVAGTLRMEPPRMPPPPTGSLASSSAPGQCSPCMQRVGPGPRHAVCRMARVHTQTHTCRPPSRMCTARVLVQRLCHVLCLAKELEEQVYTCPRPLPHPCVRARGSSSVVLRCERRHRHRRLEASVGPRGGHL